MSSMDDHDAAEAAAPAASPTANEIAAEIQQQIENMPDDAAKTVLPKDLLNPVNSELLGSPSDAPAVVPYTGQTDDYVRWKRDIVNCISTAGLGWAAKFFRDELDLALTDVVGVPVFIHAACPALTKHQGARLNMAREARIVRAQEQVHGIGAGCWGVCVCVGGCMWCGGGLRVSECDRV